MRSYEFVKRQTVREMNPDSEEFDHLDSVDQWVARYTYDNVGKYVTDQVSTTAAKRYPITQPTTIYRGMNFRTKESWDSFYAKITDGKFTIDGVSSWTPDPKAAEQFAYTQPTYHLNRDLMAAHDRQSREKENLAGYRGVILKTIVNPGQGIDVTKSSLGHEPEVILLPGEYQIEVYRTIKKFRDHLDDGDTDINSVILNVRKEDSSESEKKKFMQYVLHHHASELNDKAKHHLFLLTRPEKFWDFSVRNAESNSIIRSTNELEIYVVPTYFDYAENGYFTAKDTEIARRDAKKVIKSIVELYPQYPDHFVVQRGIRDLAVFAGVETQYIKALKQKVSKNYQDAEQEGRAINNIKDPNERRKAMELHQRKLIKILSQVN